MCQRAVFRHGTVPPRKDRRPASLVSPWLSARGQDGPKVWWGHPRPATPLRGSLLWAQAGVGGLRPQQGGWGGDDMGPGGICRGTCTGLGVQISLASPRVPQNAQLGPVPSPSPAPRRGQRCAGSWTQAGRSATILGCNLSQLPIKIP